MFRFLFLVTLLFSSVTYAQSPRPDRRVIVNAPCKLDILQRHHLPACIIIGEHVRRSNTPGQNENTNWDNRPAALLSSTTKHFALVYYYSEKPGTRNPRESITVHDGPRYVADFMSSDYPAIVYRITFDGGKTWSKFYTPDGDPVGSNYLAH